ncbi:STE20-related kinase adapter protein alpha-like isoform X2 [Ostrea edulis]|uniref:STE20-related kinase adapter protein alpha-like isoform X2 n=2 Tax=Ostrea edulis TaxID=37623 RepID=UPI0020964D29|nr:STE20-related kinase adapter protein alpha-like isoform X2 [Ostrea edulis]
MWVNMHKSSKHDSKEFGSQDGESRQTTWQADVSQYRLHTIIGKGSFDSITVHLAQHAPSGKTVTVKRIDIEKSPVEFNVFQEEVILCRRMHHENIIKYYSTFVHKKELWIILPLMGYGSARDVLHAYFKTGLPETAIAYILRDVLHALDYLHSRGVIHRSVRASHILIGGNGHVCLSGLRKAYFMFYHGKKWNQVHNYPVACKADLQWLSPEILEQNLAGYDTQSDIYSLGITSWELANGYPPFEDMPVTQMLLEKVNGTKPMLPDCTTIADLTGEEEAQHNADMENGGIDIVAIAKSRKFSSYFHSLIDRCLDKNPKCRPTAEGLLTDAMFKHLKKRSTEALPSLLQPLTPIKLANVPNVTDDGAVDSVTESMDQVDLVGEWDF